MAKKKQLLFISTILIATFFSGCTSSTVPTPTQAVQTPVPTETKESLTLGNSYNDNIDLSQKSPLFHSGMNDGCATAKGKYTKDSNLYNNDVDYHDGWFHGRRKCQPHRAA